MDPQTTRVLRNPRALASLARASVAAWIDDFAPSMGAALSYYTIFSIAPLLLIVIAVVGFVYGREAASGQIFHELRGLFGDAGAAAIQGMVKSASDPAKGVLATVLGVIALVFGATTVFSELQSALDRIWRSPAAARKEGPWSLVRSRVLSFGMILAIGFLLLVSLVLSAGISALSSLWGSWFVGIEMVLQVVNFVVSVLVITLLFGLIYRLLPRARIGWRDVWVGAGVTSLLFTLGKFLIGLYIGKSSVVSGFGAAGSLVVVLLWVYYSAQIFLLGAEFTWVYSYRHGSRRGESVPEQVVAGANKSSIAGAQPALQGRAPAVRAGDTAPRVLAGKSASSGRRSLHARFLWAGVLAMTLVSAASLAAPLARRFTRRCANLPLNGSRTRGASSRRSPVPRRHIRSLREST